ncbi:hypothetical protein Y032_0039g160 [Ancylostoma ceylanicum]|uniref:Uncharacterized protein n=1 Tax=Ancylostoma ceylanicum TaxID=53326 RepID=A0A016UHE8_9BILA|nr:hypothetical protein Y032_0039g160 [Ancylostoma ceylanicum]
MAVIDRVREAVEKQERTAVYLAETERSEREAREQIQIEMSLNASLSTELMMFKSDLDALRRILPVAAGHIRTIELAERELLEEEMIIAYLLRNEVERTFIEVLEDREVRLLVIVEASLRKSDHSLYHAWEETDARR